MHLKKKCAGEPESGLVIVESTQIMDAILADGFQPRIVVAAGRHERIAQLICLLRVWNIPLLVVMGSESVTCAGLVATMRKHKSIQAVLGCAAALDSMLESVNDGDIACRNGQGAAQVAFLATNMDTGWLLFSAISDCGNAEVAPGSVAAAGLLIDFGTASVKNDPRTGTLCAKLLEAGVRVNSGVVARDIRPCVLLGNHQSSLIEAETAIGLNLAGREDDLFPLWIQAPGFGDQWLPLIVRSLEAIAATPLNQWRRWLA